MTFPANGGRSRALRGPAKVALGAVSALTLVSATALVPAALASASSSSNALVVTGAMKGTLRIGPVTTCDGNSSGGNLSSFATTLSTKKYKNWSVTFTLAKPGAAAKKFNSSTATFVLQSGLNGWVATSGTMTLGNKSGKVNLTLSSHEGSASGTIHIKGSWSCAG